MERKFSNITWRNKQKNRFTLLQKARFFASLDNTVDNNRNESSGLE